jgi:uncharacterized membrane protein HdeD (DUF308 family)
MAGKEIEFEVSFILRALSINVFRYVDRQTHIERGDRLARIGETWVFWGNVLFVLGSVGYVVTATMTMMGCCEVANMELNLYLALLFIIDSIVYTMGAFAGESARVARPEGAIPWFRSNVDYYFLATFFFVLGSILYFVSALMVKLKQDAKWVNLWAGVIFVIDAVFYLASTLQYRDEQGKPLTVASFRSSYFHFNR